MFEFFIEDGEAVVLALVSELGFLDVHMYPDEQLSVLYTEIGVKIGIFGSRESGWPFLWQIVLKE